MGRVVELFGYLPDACKINRNIPIEAFLKNGRIKLSAQYQFKLYFQNAILAYVYRCNNMDLPNIKSKVKAGDELHIMEIEIKTRSDGWYAVINFAKAVFEAYTYPLLLVISYKDEYCFFASISHSNSRNSSKNVSDRIQGGGWVNERNRNGYQPPEFYYMLDNVHFFPVRKLEKRVCDILFNQHSIADIMKKWYELFREDRAQWSYFYHLSDEYSNSVSVINSIISTSKTIEQIYDNNTDLSDWDIPSMEDPLWFEEDEVYNDSN